MEVSWNGGTPKLSILKGFSIIKHPFSDIPISGNPHITVIDISGPTWSARLYLRSFGLSARALRTRGCAKTRQTPVWDSQIIPLTSAFLDHVWIWHEYYSRHEDVVCTFPLSFMQALPLLSKHPWPHSWASATRLCQDPMSVAFCESHPRNMHPKKFTWSNSRHFPKNLGNSTNWTCRWGKYRGNRGSDCKHGCCKGGQTVSGDLPRFRPRTWNVQGTCLSWRNLAWKDVAGWYPNLIL